MPVNPAEAKLFADLAQEAAANPPKPLDQQTIGEFRTNMAVLHEFTGPASNVGFIDQRVPARDGYQIPIRIYHPEITAPGPVLIMFPGCGYVSPLFEINSIACSRIAKYSGVKVILVDYRLAPENPLPLSIYDGYDAARYIATHPDFFKIDPNKIFIGGMSSGAHCAAVVTNLARQDHSWKIHHQILLNGVFDFTASNHAFDDYTKEDKLCTQEAMHFIFSHLGISSSDFKLPLFSPCYETDLANLPTTTFIVGEYDGLRNDTEAYCEKVKNAGNRVEKIVIPGQTHNTFIMRGAMSDGEDPAEVIANMLKGI